MKYEKDFEKVSFGFGNEQVAGRGDLSETLETDQKPASDKTALITVIIQVLIAAAGLFIKSKTSHKKDKKKSKKKKKR